MTTKVFEIEPNEIREQAHSDCIVCGHANDRSLGLKFTSLEDGSVQAVFDCDVIYAGYQNFMHGGVITLLLDGAMTNCLFAHGCLAVTAELNIRFRHPVVTGKAASIRAWIDQSSPPLRLLKAEIVQDNQVKATANGKFMDQPNLAKVVTVAHNKQQ